MINEIMLASALTLSAPPFPHYYNLDNDNAKMFLSFNDYDYQHYNSIIINLNNGSTQISNLAFYEDGDYYQKSSNTTSWHDTQTNHLHDFISSSFYDNHGSFNVDGFGLELDMDCLVSDLDILVDEIVIDCFFAIPGEDDTTLINVSGYTELRVSPIYHYAYIYAYEWVDARSWLMSDNSYLVFNSDTIEGVNGEIVDFNDITLFFKYNDIGLGYDDSNGEGQYYYGSYTDFIYNNMRDWVAYARELETVNQVLRQENEELNSKHALSSVFEIVRSAIDGVVNFLEIELMPNLTIGTIIFIPVVIGVIFFILKALVL